MTLPSLMRGLSLARTQTRVVQCLWSRTMAWPRKGIMGWNKAQWAPSSCRHLPGNTVRLFICFDATDVSLRHLAGASLRPVVDQWQRQIPRLSLPVDRVRQSVPNNPALCCSSLVFLVCLFVLILLQVWFWSVWLYFFFFYNFTFSIGRMFFFVMRYLKWRQCSLVKWETLFFSFLKVKLVWCNQRNIKNVSFVLESLRVFFCCVTCETKTFWMVLKFIIKIKPLISSRAVCCGLSKNIWTFKPQRRDLGQYEIFVFSLST